MKKKKKNNSIQSMLEDEEKFIIYQIYKPQEHRFGKKVFEPSKVASPYFGSQVVDRKAFTDNSGTMDVDLGYDYLRPEDIKHYTKEEIIAKYGSEYYEFNVLNNKKIIEYAGGGYEENATETNKELEEIRRKRDEDSKKYPDISFVEDAIDVVNEPVDGIKIPDNFDENIDDLDQLLGIRIGVDNETDYYEHNSYDENMPKPTQANIPSFLNEVSEKPELKFDNPIGDDDLSFDDIPNMEAPEITFEDEIVVEEYSNPAVDKNLTIEEAIKQAQENYGIKEPSNEVPKEAPAHKPENKEEVEISFNKYDNYEIPYASLFPKNTKVIDEHPAWLEEKKEIINETFKAFGIDGEVISYTKGPAFTLYEIMLSPGVNVKKVNQIYDNLQMNLQATSIRIQSPIPGKNTIGIEAPNDVADVVKFGDIIDEKFMNDGKPLRVALGKNIDGSPVYQDITDMPHCLIAGATQSGKSVSINTILVSLLAKNSPDTLKLILVDPKRVELAFYNNLPHLATPVISDPVEATEALKWACEEMERRYDVFARNRAKKITDYYEKRKQNPTLPPMPYIVIVVDEFNDLVMQCGNEVNECIVRLAQKARACGMHIILATQRPTVSVVNGTIKANVPCRIAFRVASQVDSQTILDEIGAESLLGRGDMIIKNTGNPLRAQGAYLPDEEIEAICQYITDRYDPDFIFTHEDLRNSIIKSQGGIGGGKDAQGENDELLYSIAVYCVENNVCSINSIQAQFALGFNRASRIVTLLENMKIVSPKNGTKPRDILVDLYQLNKIFGVDE